MRPIDFPEANAYYEKPSSMTDEECMPVSAYQHKDDKGNILSISTIWMPNKEDLEALNAGRGIVLQQGCPVLVPHLLYTVNEKGEVNG